MPRVLKWKGKKPVSSWKTRVCSGESIQCYIVHQLIPDLRPNEYPKMWNSDPAPPTRLLIKVLNGLTLLNKYISLIFYLFLLYWSTVDWQFFFSIEYLFTWTSTQHRIRGHNMEAQRCREAFAWVWLLGGAICRAPSSCCVSGDLSLHPFSRLQEIHQNNQSQGSKFYFSRSTPSPATWIQDTRFSLEL